MIVPKQKKESITHTILGSFLSLIPLVQIAIVSLLVYSFNTNSHNELGEAFFAMIGFIIFYIVSFIINPALVIISMLLTGLKSKKYIPAVILNSLFVGAEVLLLCVISFS